MSIWGVAPVLAVAFLGATGVHAQQGSAAPLVPTVAATSPVLTEVSPGEWQATIALTAVGKSCPSRAHYWLQTTSPDELILAASQTRARQAGSKLSAWPCEVTVRFSGLDQVPLSAALVFVQSKAPGPSVVPLTVSRGVSWGWYVVGPAGVGLALALALLVIVLLFLRVYDSAGEVVTPAVGSRWKVWRPNPKFWQYTMYASGAWTANDSWATNIAFATSLLASIIGAVSATGDLFPGIALDRFAIVNLVAGGIAALAPLVFGVRYARWTKRNPGLTSYARIALPLSATLPADTHMTVAKGVRLKADGSRWRRRLRAPVVVTLKEATQVRLVDGQPVLPVSGQPATLQAGTGVTLFPPTGLRQPDGATSELERPVTGHVLADSHVTLRQGAELAPLTPQAAAPQAAAPQAAAPLAEPGIAPAAGQAQAPLDTELPLGAARARLDQNVAVSTSQLPRASLMADTWVGVAVGAAITLPAGTTAQLANRKIVLAGEALGSVAEPGSHRGLALNAGVTIPPWTMATLGDVASVGYSAICYRPDTDALLDVPGGAAITVPAGATIITGDTAGHPRTELKAGGVVQVPPGSRIRIRTTGVLSLPGGSDVFATGSSSLEITAADAGVAQPLAGGPEAGGPEAGGPEAGGPEAGGPEAGGAEDDGASSAGVLAIDASAVVLPAVPAASGAGHPAAQAGQGPAHAGAARAHGHAAKSEQAATDEAATVMVRFPVRLTVHSGLKVTVTDVADLRLPVHTSVTTPHRRDFAISKERHLLLPQGTSTLAATMGMVLTAAFVTMFGVGAVIGTLGELAAYFSDASTVGHALLAAVAAGVFAFTLWYSVTAIRTLADPQPGSSISATPGTSFTL
jgi:hypothetical protein